MKKYLFFTAMLLVCIIGAKAQSPVADKPKEKKVFEDYYIGDYRFKSRNNWVLFGFGPNFKPSLPNFTNANM